MDSPCAKIDLWQLPKSSPQILIFLSAEPEISILLSEEMSIVNTGSLWPNNVRNNLSESEKQIFMLLSNRAKA